MLRRHQFTSLFFSGLLLISALSYIGYQYLKFNPKRADSEKQKNQNQIINYSTQTPYAYNIPILMYHYVEYVKDFKDTIRKSLDTSPHVFEQQIVTLQNAGYTFLTMRDIAKILNHSMPAPQKAVVLTFDDGYGSFYTDVYPMIKKYNIKVTEFIIPGFIGKLNYMTKEQIIDIYKSGLVEIGSHTINHVNLYSKSKSEMLDEVIKSKSQLEQLIGVPVISFAYPYGIFDQQVINAVRNAGYLTGVTTKEGKSITEEYRFILPRLRPGVQTGDSLINFIIE